MSFLKWVLVITALAALGYNLWSASGRNYGKHNYTPYPIDQIITEGFDAGKGNIIGFQPYFTAWDYCDQQHFVEALDPYFQKASAAGLCRPNTIIVLPEYTGSWLVAANEKATVYQADSMRQAVSIIVNSRIFSFFLKLFSAKPQDKIQYALFSLKARSMAKIYATVFSSLAKKYKVTIVAGSIILPGPSVNAKGKLSIKQGQLYNASFIFGPEGTIIAPPIKKMVLTGNEKNFLTPAGNNEHHIVRTPSGNLAVLLSADSLNAAYYHQRKEKVSFVAFPSIEGLDSLQMSMKTFSPANNADTSTQTQKATWPHAGLNNMKAAGIHRGIHVFFSGKIWEMQPKGNIVTLQNDSLHVYQPDAHKGRIINLWLD